MKHTFNMVGNIISIILLVVVLPDRSSSAIPKGLDIAKFKEQNIICHNKYRAKHGVKPLSYNNQLDNVAQNYAEQLAQKDAGLVHSSNELGENLYSSWGQEVDGYSACNSWYDEIKDYNYDQDQPSNLMDVGHFTALVWKGSCIMGVGIATSKLGWTYVVTNYDPAGNGRDKFHTNVFRPGTPQKSNKNMTAFELLMSEDKVICSDVDRDTFLKQNLECQNMVRQRHGAPALTYSNEMNEYAMKQAEILAKTGTIIGNDKYGVISYYASGGKKEGYSACKSWYQASKLYNYNAENNPSNTFAFTQMVWKSSRLTGIGIARSESGELFVISVYDPPGNFMGEFERNVLPGKNTIGPAVQSTIDLGEVPIKKKSNVDIMKFKEQNLVCHNKYREKHGVKSLSYNDQLNNIAQKYAEHLAQKDAGPVHSSNGLGENLYISWGQEVDGYSACNSWYDEIKDYNYDQDQPTNLIDVGHFTALAWKGSCFMGVGIATSKSGWTYVVTNYDPAGNGRDKFRTNVFRPGTQQKSNKNMSAFELLMSEDKVICSDVERDTFLKQNLECQNMVRQRHGAPALSYSDEMNEYAMQLAEILAKTGNMVGSGKYGVISYFASGGKKEGYSACKYWYQASKKYDYNSENNPSNSFSFTQMIWKSSRLTGVGIVRSDNGELFVTSVYDPPGNFIGEFKDNVLPPVAGRITSISPSNESTITGSTTTDYEESVKSSEELPVTTIPDRQQMEIYL